MADAVLEDKLRPLVEALVAALQPKAQDTYDAFKERYVPDDFTPDGVNTGETLERTLGGKRVTVRRKRKAAQKTYEVVNRYAIDDFASRHNTWRSARHFCITQCNDTDMATRMLAETYPHFAVDHVLPFERYAKAGVIRFL